MKNCPDIPIGEVWGSIKKLGAVRPGLQNLILTPESKNNFINSPARKTWKDLRDREDHSFMPGEVTRLARVRGEGVKQDLVAETIPLNLIRSLFLRYWLFREAPGIYDQCKRVINHDEQLDTSVQRHGLKNAGLWEESQSYALSNMALQWAAKQNSFRDRSMRTLSPRIQMPPGVSSLDYQCLREMTAGRIRSALEPEKSDNKDPLLASVVDFLRKSNSNQAVDGVGAIEQGLIEKNGGQKTGPQDILNCSARQIRSIVLSGIKTCYLNASAAKPSIFPNSEGYGIGPSDSVSS